MDNINVPMPEDRQFSSDASKDEFKDDQSQEDFGFEE